jgi:Lrp/AsnC family leucine-responsive transcriptional regulator
MSAIVSPAARTNRNENAPDSVDLALVAELQRDGRMSAEELSSRVALSRPAIVARLKRLRENGTIQRFTAVVDWESLGYPILAFVHVRTSRFCREQARTVMAMSDAGALVEECHRTTGEWCLLVKVRARSASALESLIDRMRDEENVVATMTTLALSTLSASA